MKDNDSEISKIKFYLLIPNVNKDIEKNFVKYLEAILNIQYKNSLIDDSVIDDNPIINKIKELHSKGVETQLVNIGMGMINSYENRLLNEGSSYDDYTRSRTIDDTNEDTIISHPNNLGFGIAIIILICTAILGIGLGALLFVLVRG